MFDLVQGLRCDPAEVPIRHPRVAVHHRSLSENVWNSIPRSDKERSRHFHLLSNYHSRIADIESHFNARSAEQTLAQRIVLVHCNHKPVSEVQQNITHMSRIFHWGPDLSGSADFGVQPRGHQFCDLIRASDDSPTYLRRVNFIPYKAAKLNLTTFVIAGHKQTLRTYRDGLAALQISDHATGNTHDVRGHCTEVVVPRSGRGPHLVVLQQIRIDEDAQLSRVAERGHAAIGLSNSMLHYRRMWRLFPTSH